MKYRHLLMSALLPAVLVTSGCGKEEPLDVKGVWQATKGDCGSYCKFIITDNVLSSKPEQHYILFVERPGAEDIAYVLEPVTGNDKENEWTFDYIVGTGHLYQDGKNLVTKGDVTYKKIGTVDEANKKAIIQ